MDGVGEPLPLELAEMFEPNMLCCSFEREERKAVKLPTKSDFISVCSVSMKTSSPKLPSRCIAAACDNVIKLQPAITVPAQNVCSTDVYVPLAGGCTEGPSFTPCSPRLAWCLCQTLAHAPRSGSSANE